MKSLIDIINEKLILSKTKYKHPEDEYFYHEALEDGYRTMFNETDNILQYSIDNCQTWHYLKLNRKTPEINKEERIYFKGEKVKANISNGIGTFKSNKKFNAGGNIMSLIYGDDFENKNELIDDYQFKLLFYENVKLVSAKDLVLPATELTEECYCSMFFECTSLTEAPELPATELAYGCYYSMFSWCKLLIKAPELPATKLVTECYNGMFYKCKSLKEITMLATDISADDCLCCWVAGVSDTGTFIKTKSVDIPEGIHGIQKRWTIREI
jgi:hypothetical protein